MTKVDSSKINIDKNLERVIKKKERKEMKQRDGRKERRKAARQRKHKLSIERMNISTYSIHIKVMRMLETTFCQ